SACKHYRFPLLCCYVRTKTYLSVLLPLSDIQVDELERAGIYLYLRNCARKFDGLSFIYSITSRKNFPHRCSWARISCLEPCYCFKCFSSLRLCDQVHNCITVFTATGEILRRHWTIPDRSQPASYVAPNSPLNRPSPVWPV
ncbi:hypothetical protein Tcan_01545, partial [Toxocara canis]